MECLNCSNNVFYESIVGSKGGYGPDLLPGTGIFTPAKFKIMICSKCGFTHWFVGNSDLEKVKKSKKFRKI